MRAAKFGVDSLHERFQAWGGGISRGRAVANGEERDHGTPIQ